jgi:hypothetical protein
MKLKSIFALLTLSLVMWAQAPAPAPKAKDKSAAAECACCKDMAKDHTGGDCCKAGKCEMKDGASCPMMKDAKAQCMGEKGCCAGMKDMKDMNHDSAHASKKPDVTADGQTAAHCSMMAKDGKSGCCGGHGKDMGK